jgi:hypothetical protein
VPHTKPRKRPCSICRKWFLADVRQAGRQKTCSAQCSRELHRRSCGSWNQKNTAYFKSNYLDEKLQKDGRSPPGSTQADVDADAMSAPPSRIRLNLPRDIIDNRIGGDALIIVEYVVEQVFGRIRNNATGFRRKVIQLGF